MANPALVIRVAANLAELKANLIEGKAQIETTTAAMTKLAAGLQGDKLIQRAHDIVAAVNQIGGVSKLTEAEQVRLNATLEKAIEKYRVLGKEAPASMVALAEATRHTGTEVATAHTTTASWLPTLTSLASAFGITFSISSVVAFGRELLRTGDELVKMADRTGLTVEQVQRLQYIGDQTSASFESLTGAVQNLQQRLGDEDKGAIAALRALGLYTQEFLDLNSYDQFIQIGNALSAIEDPTRRASLAANLFGKSWKEILPALTQDMQALAAEAPVMAESTAKMLDAVGDAASRMWSKVKAAAADVAMAALVDLTAKLGWQSEKAWAPLDQLAKGAKTVGETFTVTAGQAKALTMSEDDLAKATAQVTQRSVDLAEIVEGRLSRGLTQLPGFVFSVAEEYRRYAAAAKEAEDATRKAAQAAEVEADAIQESGTATETAGQKAAASVAGWEKLTNAILSFTMADTLANAQLNDSLFIGYEARQFLTRQRESAGPFAPIQPGFLPGFAEGGIVTTPTLAMVGERGPEAIVPLNRGGGGGGHTTISVTVDARGASFPSRASMDELGKRAADAIAQRLRAQGQRF